MKILMQRCLFAIYQEDPRIKDKVSNDLKFFLYYMKYFFVQKCIIFSRMLNILFCFSKNSSESKFGHMSSQSSICSVPRALHGQQLQGTQGNPKVELRPERQNHTPGPGKAGPSAQAAGKQGWEAPFVFPTLIFWEFINHLTHSWFNISSQNWDWRLKMKNSKNITELTSIHLGLLILHA